MTGRMLTIIQPTKRPRATVDRTQIGALPNDRTVTAAAVHQKKN